jgi:galactose oxidase
MFFNGSWYLLSNQATERTYHSMSLLLDDGRVLSAGGDSCHDSAEYEVFTPPYLMGSHLRPTFSQAPPAIIRYGQQFAFVAGLPFGQSLDRVVLLRPGSVTHSQDPGQRWEPLSLVPPPIDDTVTTTALAPANPTLYPPGYCMLFLVSAGVPSVAHWVQLLP